jgi:hypothetical protein
VDRPFYARGGQLGYIHHEARAGQSPLPEALLNDRLARSQTLPVSKPHRGPRWLSVLKQVDSAEFVAGVLSSSLDYRISKQEAEPQKNIDAANAM